MKGRASQFSTIFLHRFSLFGFLGGMKREYGYPVQQTLIPNFLFVLNHNKERRREMMVTAAFNPIPSSIFLD
jgi:hypothetical protein